MSEDRPIDSDQRHVRAGASRLTIKERPPAPPPPPTPPKAEETPTKKE